MSELAVFKFRDAFPVRVSDREGEPWFVAADVCKALAISNSRTALANLDEDEISGVEISYTGKSGRQLTNRLNIISESGLYALIIRSSKPAAREFRKWITAEVLPAIRRTGRYEAAAAVPAVREKPLVQTIAEMVRNLNERITAGEDVPAHVLKYAWNMAGITRDLTLRKQRNALFAAPDEFTLRETAPDAETQIISALEEQVTPLPGLPPVNGTTDRVFIRSAALEKMLGSMPEEWRGKEVELLRRAAVFLPRVSQKIRRFPNHASGPIKRKSGILWNENGTGQVRIVDLRRGQLVEIERN